MEVYVEVVILNNLAIDLFLMILTYFCTKQKVKKLRVFIGAIVGTAGAVFYPLMGKYKILLAVTFAPVLTLVFYKSQNLKQYILGLVVFAALTFSLGGIMTGISNLTGIELTANLIPAVALFSVMFLFYFIWHIVYVVKKHKRIEQVVLKIYGDSLNLKALYDTGNSLVDGDKPVIVLSKKWGEKYISKSDREIVVKTVGGLSTLKLLEGEYIKFKQRGEVHFSVAVSKEHYVGYDVVLHNSFC